MSVPFESTPLAAVVDVSSPLAAVVYESSPQAAVIFIGPYSSQLPGVELGPKDHYFTAWWKYQASRNLQPPSRELVIPAGPAGNSLELCAISWTHSKLKDRCPVLLGISSSAVVLLGNADNQDLFSSRLPVRVHYCASRYIQCVFHFKKTNFGAVFLFRKQF